MKAIKITAAMVMVLAILVITTGCLFGPQLLTTFVVEPQTGIPSLFDGGMKVMFASNGIIDSIDYGDGTEVGVASNHLYEKVGIYTATARIMDSGKVSVRSITITVLNDEPEVYPPFFAGSYPQLRGVSILDGRKQQHSCPSSGDGARNYGAWPRYGETFTYDWKIVIKFIDEYRRDIVVYADGSEDYPLSMIGWHVGEEYKIFPDLLPVPQVNGVWIPFTLQPKCNSDGCATDEDFDNWDGWNVALPAVGQATVFMTVTNQLGCYSSTFNTWDVFDGGGCE